jgi:hypothetical protein
MAFPPFQAHEPLWVEILRELADGLETGDTGNDPPLTECPICGYLNCGIDHAMLRQAGFPTPERAK